MLYRLENSLLYPISQDIIDDQKHYIAIVNFQDIQQIKLKHEINEKILLECLSKNANAFESHDGIDYICLHTLSHKLLPEPMEKMCLCICSNLMVFVLKDVSSFEQTLFQAAPEQKISLSKLYSVFMERLTARHVDILEGIEAEISDLENALLTTKKRNCIKEIIALRKKLMTLKRYYEQFLNVLDFLQVSENELLDRKTMRYLQGYTGRIDRLYHNVINLRDYVTQVRESYQAEIDISLNYVMKVFTVITAVFLPLTLIVGWYGMNLMMPEFEWAGSYPMVILLSIAVIVFCIAYFKKHKWF